MCQARAAKVRETEQVPAEPWRVERATIHRRWVERALAACAWGVGGLREGTSHSEREDQERFYKGGAA